MGKRKWIPISEENVIETKRCRYVFGLYDHQEYGRSCFRISKYIRDNDFFVGHFVVVPEDQETVLPEIVKYIEFAAQRSDSLSKVPTKLSSVSADCRLLTLPGMEKDLGL
ncbi:MAG: hypothetical protein GY832_01005 [Chloroflexi bacterium]|nr:hypothetical protein [Chloroflexota bacterium]